MVVYGRNFVSGGTFFFTVTLQDRCSRLLVENIDLLREAFRVTRREKPFTVDAVVVLPEHLHTIFTLPPGDADFSGRWRRIKSLFSRLLASRNETIRKNYKGEYSIWQRRFWEHTIRDDGDFERHVNYIHFNPVKHALVLPARDWPHSSFHRFVKLGLLSVDWGGSGVPVGDRFGEPK